MRVWCWLCAALLCLAHGDEDKQHAPVELGNNRVLVTYEEDSLCTSWFLFLPATNSWSTGTRGFLFLTALLYCFLGIAIVADVFMGSIEKITSKMVQRTRVVDGEKVVEEVPFWNATIANLSLMALGSSAPEILLSLLETSFNLGKPPGELGPGTIVGSAAFNLMFISAVCVAAVPDGEVRRIKDFGVFIIEAIASVWAYIWIFIVLVVWTKDEVTLEEAILTFLYFPILLVLAWCQDRNWFRKAKVEETRRHSVVDSLDVKDLARNIREHPEDADTASQIRHLLPHEEHDRLTYRMNAVRKLVGKRRVLPTHVTTPPVNADARVAPDDSPEKSTSEFQFRLLGYVVSEHTGSVTIEVERKGCTKTRGTVDYLSSDLTATAPSDYEAVGGTLVFEPGETLKTIPIKVVQDNQPEDDENFLVTLSNPSPGTTIGSWKSTVVTILDDDVPGFLGFRSPASVVSENDHSVTVQVNRNNGTGGEITVDYSTVDDSARGGVDYESVTGTLKFAPGQTTQFITIPIIDTDTFNKSMTFSLFLRHPTGGATLTSRRIHTVTITSEQESKEAANKVLQAIRLRSELLAFSTSSWRQQFESAIMMEGDIDDAGNRLPPSTMDFVMHFLTIGWKVLFAFIPPTEYAGGWCAFSVALVFIGVITAVVGELAGLFGCVVGLKAPVTAITFVALGTSLPDTFASKQAAAEADHADAAIGNVVGSNAVNVFLGLGLPWLLGASYYVSQGQKFNVPAGDLALGVTIFLITGSLCLITLIVRRHPSIGGELGGPLAAKWATSCFFVFLWITYVVVASLGAYGYF